MLTSRQDAVNLIGLGAFGLAVTLVEISGQGADTLIGTVKPDPNLGRRLVI